MSAHFNIPKQYIELHKRETSPPSSRIKKVHKVPYAFLIMSKDNTVCSLGKSLCSLINDPPSTQFFILDSTMLLMPGNGLNNAYSQQINCILHNEGTFELLSLNQCTQSTAKTEDWHIWQSLTNFTYNNTHTIIWHISSFKGFFKRNSVDWLVNNHCRFWNLRTRHLLLGQIKIRLKFFSKITYWWK